MLFVNFVIKHYLISTFKNIFKSILISRGYYTVFKIKTSCLYISIL